MNFIVSGIGTDVGKTVASAILCKILEAAYWKPVQSGAVSDSDKRDVQQWLPDLKTFPETFVLEAPLSPHKAAELENKKLEVDQIQAPEHDGHLIIEGAGGLLVPINWDFHYADWFKKMNWPVILVSRHYLGSINHTLLSIEYLKSQQIPIAGVLFNGTDDKGNEEAISQFGKVPNLGCIEEIDKVNSAFIQEQAERLAPQIKKMLLK